MKVIEKYTGTKTYMFPNGAIATPAIMEENYPAITVFTHIIETDSTGEVCFAVQNLSAMRDFYEIDATLTEAEAIDAMQVIINTPPDNVPSAEERIASSLEFQNLMML